MDSGFEIKYRKLFRTYYANLLFYAKRIVGDDDAEDVVQDVFVELWHRKKTKITDEQRRCVKMHLQVADRCFRWPIYRQCGL